MQTLWAPSILFVLLLFVLPIYSTLSAQSYMESAIGSSWKFGRVYVFYHVLGDQNYGMRIITMLFGIFTGWNLFSYLHSTSQVDLYHSLSISRRKLFLSNFIAGNLAFLIPYLVNAVLALILFVGITSYADMGAFLVEILHNLIFFDLFFLIGILGSLMTGTKVTTVLMTAVLLEMTQILLLGTHTLAERLLYTFESYDWDWHIYTSPVTLNFVEEDTTYMIFVVLGLFLLSVMLFEIRPSELSGRSVWGRWFPQFIKYYSLAGLAIVGGIIFGDIGSSKSWMYFGFAFTIFFGHLIIEGIYHFDVRQVFRNWGGMIAFAAVFFLIWGSFTLDFWKYDRRYTSADQAEYYEVDLADPYYGSNSYSYLMVGGKGAKIRVSSDQGKKLVDQLIQKGIEGAVEQRDRDKKKDLYDEETSSTEAYDPYSYSADERAEPTRITVKPKGRPAYKRVYRNIKLSDFNKIMLEFYDMQECKSAAIESFMSIDPNTVRTLALEFLVPDSSYDISLDNKKDILQLMKAVEEDFLDVRAEEVENSLTVALLEFDFDYDMYRNNEAEYPGYFAIPIFECYERTLSLLEKKDYLKYKKLTAEDVIRAEIPADIYEILRTKEGLKLAADPKREEDVILVTDPDQIEILMENFAYSEMLDYNPFITAKDLYTIPILLKEPYGESIYVSYIKRLA